jgi:transposase
MSFELATGNGWSAASFVLAVAAWRQTRPRAPQVTIRRGMSKSVSAQRNTVERGINGLKQWGGTANRYDKTATIYMAGLHVAGFFLWSAR